MKKYLTEIKTNLQMKKSNLGYKHDFNFTDKKIKLYLSKKQIGGLDMVPEYKSKFRAEFDYSKKHLIEYFDKKMRSLPPDDLEFIPRKYWCRFEELRGANLNNLSHPVFRLGHQIIKDNYVKNSDTILIQSCGNMKPYIDNPNYKDNTLKYHRAGMCDLFVSSWNLVPIDFTPFFPWRYYEWNHKLETPFMTNLCIENEVYNIIDIVNHFDYKKIILFAPGKPDYFYTELFRRLKEVIKDRELIFVLDDERMKILKKHFNNQNGLVKTRYSHDLEILNYLKTLLEEPKDKECFGLKDQNQIEYIKNSK